MARIVCQVLHRPECLTFIWSQASASFAPYHLRGERAEAFRQLAGQAHERLADAVGAGSVPALADIGWRLFQMIFPADSIATEIQSWLADLRGKDAIDALEIVSDEPGSIPWNVVYEKAPDERALAEGQPDALGAFWGMRHPISSGRRVNSWRHIPALERPNVLLAIDPVLREALPEDQKSRLREFADAKALRVIESKSALETALAEPTDFLYVFCRAQSHGLVLGEDPIAWGTFRDRVQGGDTEPLVYLNLGRAGVDGAAERAESCVQRLVGMGLDGLITTEHAGPAEAGNAFALDVLSRFLFGGERLGAALQKARAQTPGAGLLVTASCPAHLRVVWDEDADIEEPPDSPPSAPLPDRPYRPLAPYDREDRALFAGRDDDVADFVSRLDRADTRFLILHGLSGVGKSSFLHAGVVPYLEDEAVGFQALRDRTPEESPVAERDFPVIAVRASHDLAGQLAEALCAFCSQPYHFTAPNGKSFTLDLPGILRKLAGLDGSAAATSTAVREFSPRDQIQASSGGSPPPLPEANGNSSKVEGDENATIAAASLWDAMQNDVGLLARILAEISHDFPGELIILIEQGEEIFTQARRPVDQRRRRLALEMLARVAGGFSRCKLIFSMRTEYLGRLLDDFPGQHVPPAFLLPALGEDAVLQAVILPTVAEPLPYAGEIPFEKYGFTFAEGVPQAIVRNVRDTANGVYLLPRVQAVCAQLYDSVLARSDRVITQADLKLLAKGDSAFQLSQYVDKALGSLHRADRRRFMDLCQKLCRREADGSVARSLVPYGDFAADWRGSVPADSVLETTSADNVRVLEINQLLIGGKENLYVSLSHDALAQTAQQWSEEQKRAVYGRGKMADMLWIFIPLLFLVAVIVYVTMRHAAPGEGTFTTEEMKKIFQENFPKQFLSQFPGHAEKTLGYSLYIGRISEAEQARQAGDTLRMRQLLLSQQREENDLRGFEWFYLWGQALQQRKEMLGHKGLITSVAVSPDGKTLASASLDGTVKLWDANGTIRATFEGNAGAVHAVVFAPDGKTIAGGGADKLVRLWDVPAGDNYVVVKKAAKTLTGHTGAVLSLSFGPDKARLASGSADKTIIIWDLAKGAKQSELKEHAGSVLAVVFSPDGKTLASAGGDHAVYLWETASGKKQQTLPGHGGPVFALAYSPDGDQLASGGVEAKDNLEIGTVHLWDAKAGKPIGGKIQHSRGTFALAFGPGGKTLFTAGKDSLIRVWDPNTGDVLGALHGHLGWVRTLALTADGDTLVSGSYDQSVKVWHPPSALRPGVLRGHKDWVCSVAFSPDDRIVASAGRDGTVKLWDAVTGTELQTLGGLGPVMSVAFSPAKGAPKLAAATWSDKGSGEVKIWELSPKKGQTGLEARELHVLKGHQAGIACLAFSRDGKSLASGGNDKVAILWDVASGKPKKLFKGHTGGIRALSLSFDGALLATGGDDKLIRIWDTSTAKDKEPPIAGHTAAITALAFFPDGWLISSGYDQTIRFWKDGASGGMLRGHGNAILSLAIDGHLPEEKGPELIFSGSWDNTVKVWGLRPGTDERFTFRGHSGPVRGLALSNDRRTLASASHDGTVRLWRAADSAAFRTEHH